jgi:hypothetical protein
MTCPATTLAVRQPQPDSAAIDPRNNLVLPLIRPNTANAYQTPRTTRRRAKVMNWFQCYEV